MNIFSKQELLCKALPFVAAFLFTQTANALTDTSTITSSKNTPPTTETISLISSPVTSLGQTAAALLFVLLLIWGCAWVVRRFLHHGALGLPSHARVISAISLGGRERLVIVELGEEWLILGVSSASVTLLRVLPKPEQVQSSLPNTLFTAKFKEFLRHPSHSSSDKVEK